MFWVPQQARWDEIKAVSILNIGAELPWGGKFSGVAKLIDDAFDAIEKDNEKLKGVLQRISGYAVNEDTLRGLIILFSDTNYPSDLQRRARTFRSKRHSWPRLRIFPRSLCPSRRQARRTVFHAKIHCFPDCRNARAILRPRV